MRALTVAGGEVVTDERPDPTPGTGEILVRVRAAGINAADLLQRQGLYPAPPGAPADIPGLELAGEVIACGPDATRFSPGDRVMALVGGGAQAELAVVHERVAMPVPDGVSWEVAGAFPETFITAHDALFTQCGLGPGERLLVHGGAGGVGTSAVQLGVAVGAQVTASVRDPKLRPRVEALGAGVVPHDDFAGGGPFDVILELVGAVNLEANLSCLAGCGRISIIGLSAGGRGEIDLFALMGKRARIHGSTLRSRPLEAKAEAARQVERHVLPLLGAGKVAPPVEAVFPLDDAAAAYQRFAAGGKFGKVVLACG
ncbi:MAG TPA: NAD(P)H-quinone oxidoreductase [Acidimicrobiales bacterium]|nr:NAD(P)H-quinone oxidoreductase [Acidimicrobiales bacterium]